MGKFRKFFMLAACLLPLCQGQVWASVDSHIVTRVEVVCSQAQGPLTRQYTQSRKMEAVLNYLRLAKYAGIPEEVPPQNADACRVTVYLAPGGSHVYDLRDWQFLSRDQGPWEMVELQDPPLWQLLWQLPSDT